MGEGVCDVDPDPLLYSAIQQHSRAPPVQGGVLSVSEKRKLGLTKGGMRKRQRYRNKGRSRYTASIQRKRLRKRGIPI